MEKLSHLFYRDEHISCANYKTTSNTGFKYVELNAGQQLNSEFMPQHNLILQMSGRLSVTCDKHPTRTLEEWQMILIPKSASMNAVIIEDSKIVLFGFDMPLSTCDKIRFKAQAITYKDIIYDFVPTKIKTPLKLFLNLIVNYLSSGLSCVHMHESKHKELFICLRAFYSKEEVAYLLHPIMHNAVDFQNIILEHKEDFTCIDDMIEVTNMSRTRFFVKFKKVFKVTAKQWMLKHQISKIRHTATTPNISVKELMIEAGFETTAQFSQFCKLHFACTPSELIRISNAVNQKDR